MKLIDVNQHMEIQKARKNDYSSSSPLFLHLY